MMVGGTSKPSKRWGLPNMSERIRRYHKLIDNHLDDDGPYLSRNSDILREIRTRNASKKYREGWDRIWGSKQKTVRGGS